MKHPKVSPEKVVGKGTPEAKAKLDQFAPEAPPPENGGPSPVGKGDPRNDNIGAQIDADPPFPQARAQASKEWVDCDAENARANVLRAQAFDRLSRAAERLVDGILTYVK